MHLSLALAALTLVFQASAFLIPLEVAEAAEAADLAETQLHTWFTEKTHSYDLECSSCPFPSVNEDGVVVTVEDVATKIHLEFAIDSEQGLLINGNPGAPQRPSEAVVLTATQTRTDDETSSDPIYLPLSHALERLPPVKEGKKELIPWRFTIFAINGRAVKVDTIVINLIHCKKTGQTRIAKVESIPFAQTPGASTCNTTSQWSLCRLRAIITSHIQNLVESVRTHAKSAHGWVKSSCQKGNKIGGKHHGHGHHGHHEIHHRVRKFRHMLHQAIRFFIIPALLGVIGGLMASALGMLVGQLIVYTWLRFGRGGRRGPVANIRVVEVAVNADEKDTLVEAPPAYENAPAYEDAPAVQVNVDDKH